MNEPIELTQEFRSKSISVICINESKEYLKIKIFIQDNNGSWHKSIQKINKKSLEEI